jgi:gliding motility-associated-like protein
VITQNGDGVNDFFNVNCIELFPNNNVKIFNRAGALVYESDNYDNAVKFFNGKGNKGVYIMDENLPVGTYFYIVDKRDGSKPLTGYLELLR